MSTGPIEASARSGRRGQPPRRYPVLCPPAPLKRRLPTGCDRLRDDRYPVLCPPAPLKPLRRSARTSRVPRRYPVLCPPAPLKRGPGGRASVHRRAISGVMSTGPIEATGTRRGMALADRYPVLCPPAPLKRERDAADVGRRIPISGVMSTGPIEAPTPCRATRIR